MDNKEGTSPLWVRRQQLHELLMSGNLFALDELEQLEERTDDGNVLGHDVLPRQPLAHPSLHAPTSTGQVDGTR